MTTWDSTVDFVVVGSGGGGLVAALAAADTGASVLVVEKQDLIGGTAAWSGGIVLTARIVASGMPSRRSQATSLACSSWPGW